MAIDYVSWKLFGTTQAANWDTPNERLYLWTIEKAESNFVLDDSSFYVWSVQGINSASEVIGIKTVLDGTDLEFHFLVAYFSDNTI